MQLPDRTAEYQQRDLHAEGVWGHASKPRYGGVIFNERGEVLLREPLNHFDGYVWTFPKGAANPREHPADAATREVFEETGSHPRIVGHLESGFTGGRVGSTNFYYVTVTSTDQLDGSALRRNRETANVRWATHDEARQFISQTTNWGGKRPGPTDPRCRVCGIQPLDRCATLTVLCRSC
jgi:ADP-ribose pyrophosphatase YjhB (NUDIX family)